MSYWIKNNIGCIIMMAVAGITACNSKPAPPADPLFTVLDHTKTGLHFSNQLSPADSFNMFHYMYFYNGAGIGAGDFNNDGKIDLFFAANQGDNHLYLNEGGLQFKEVTAVSKLPQDKTWSTGVSVVDINNDGLLDIYLCKVGNYKTLKAANQLFICKGLENGIPVYKEEAAVYGLNFSGFSTQSVFFDFDRDGDLDMFLLNHSVHQNGTFAPRKAFLGTYNAVSGDKMYRNDGNRHFTDITKESKINSSAISYGLGVAVADINLDGWPDLYAGNDFHENDYLYINQKNGTFSEEGTQRMMHTSQFSMGVDIADVNNDGYTEIISMDMLPEDPYILKRSLGEDEYDIFNHKVNVGYSWQYTRNNLQYNRRNGMFSEVGLYSGVFATDWSWAPLWVDFDNDGWKDLFISNGIPKRMNDMDYVNFISNSEIQQQLKNNTISEKNMSLVNKFPEIKIPNKFYHNKKNMQFEDVAGRIKNDQSTFSSGAVYADLDNDGDLDIVVNNVDQPVLVYENNVNHQQPQASVKITLKGSEHNRNAIGARVVLFNQWGISTYEKYPARGFLSSMEQPLHIGISNMRIDSAFLIWPDQTYQTIQLDTNSLQLQCIYQKGLPLFPFEYITKKQQNNTYAAKEIILDNPSLWRHEENPFIEFNREILIPHMVATEGPALAVGDLNKDGLEDVFRGASKTFHNAVLLQQANGSFKQSVQPEMAADSMHEDVDAVIADVNNDGWKDIVIASGGNEYYGEDEHLKPRLFLNSATGVFKKSNHAFGNIFVTQSCIVPHDFNKDGFVDLFIGGRSVPWEYGKKPTSYLLQNDGTGKFKDITAQYAPELSAIGMVTNAQWADMNKDGIKDLLVCCEWGYIYAFISEKGTFIKKQLTTKSGWWNFILPVDINNDGQTDLIAGNLGLNSRLKASTTQPVKMYYHDFDNNGKKEQVLTYFLHGKEIPFANKDELQKQMPFIKKKFLYAGDFAKASLEEIFTKEKLAAADLLSANYFSNALLVNKGNLEFETVDLPWEAQLSPLKAATVIDANGDAFPDVLIAGNFYDNNIQMGRYDADFGNILVNNGNASFSVSDINGVQIKGQVRSIKPIIVHQQPLWILAKNNEPAMMLQFTRNK